MIEYERGERNMKIGLWKIVYNVASWIFILGVTVQVLLAGLALFMDTSHWINHIQFARYLFFLPIVMAITAYFAQFGKANVWKCLGLFGIFIGLFFTAAISSKVGLIGALHPVLALLLFWRGIKALRIVENS